MWVLHPQHTFNAGLKPTHLTSTPAHAEYQPDRRYDCTDDCKTWSSTLQITDSADKPQEGQG